MTVRVSSSTDFPSFSRVGQHDVGSLAKNGRHLDRTGSTQSVQTVQSTRSHRSPQNSLTNLAHT